MNNYKFLIILFVSTLIFVSCEKVIEVDLNSGAEKIVIEGLITDKNPVWVKISKTTDFFNPETPENVEDAIIKIDDNQGNSFDLTETSEGFYTNPLLYAVPGTIYTMTVNIDGIEYTSTSEMNIPPQLDTIYIEKNVISGERTNYHLDFRFIVNENSSKYTKIDIIRNSDYFGFFLALSDSRPIFLPFEENDTLFIKFYSLDKTSYEYFWSLWNQTGALQDTQVPTNAIKNWTNDALGYFSATGESSTIVIVK